MTLDLTQIMMKSLYGYDRMYFIAKAYSYIRMADGNKSIDNSSPGIIVCTKK